MIEKLARVLAVVGLLLAALPALAQKDFPYGWHELKGDELASRTADEIMLHADFDGDGKQDTVVILADDRGRAEGLFAFPTSTSRWVKLDSDKVEKFKGNWIALRRPGVVKTECAQKKDEGGCKDGKPDEVSMVSSGISLLKREQSGSLLVTLFYWDRESKSFKQVPLAVAIVD